MRKIELSKQAQFRLKEITDYYILHESPERTLKVLNSFDEAFHIIGNNPFIYRKYTSKQFAGIDIRIYLDFKTYHIYFIIYPDSIKISEIFHLKQKRSKIKIGL